MSGEIINKVFNDEKLKEVPILLILSILESIVKAEVEVDNERISKRT